MKIILSILMVFSFCLSVKANNNTNRQIGHWEFEENNNAVLYSEIDKSAAFKIDESKPRITDQARVKIIQTKNGSTIGTADGQRLRGVPMAYSASDLVNPFETKIFNPDFYKTARNMGFNAVRCFVDQPDVYNELKVNESLAILDTIVNLASKYGLQLMLNAGNIGYFRNNEPQELIRLIQYNKVWNGILATRYRNRTHVIFEQQNEPFYDNPFAYPRYIQDMADCYGFMRSIAPDSHISLFTFMLSCGYSMLDQVKLLENKIKIDWTKTTVAYHGYGPPCQNIEKITELMKGYPVVETEFWPEKNMGEGGFDTDYEMAGLEDNEISWFTWWLHTGETGLYIYEPIFADLKSIGKMWDFTTIDLQEPTVNCGIDTIVFLPKNTITLKGLVTDNGSIVKYNWFLLKQPENANVTFTQNNEIAELSNMIKGSYHLRLFVWDNDNNYTYDDITVVLGNLQNIPGKIEAEDYSAAYGIGGTTAIGWIGMGDYTEYIVDIASSGLYSINVNASAAADFGGTGRFLIDGVRVSSIFTVTTSSSPDDWNSFFPAYCSAQLTEGRHTLRWEPVSVKAYNIDYFVFTNTKATIETTPDLTLKLPVNNAELIVTATDPSGIKSYEWKVIQAPKAFLFSGIKHSSTYSVNQLIVGDYIFQAIVTTNENLVISKDVKVSVTACDDNPTVTAGADRKFSLPQDSVKVSIVTTSGSGIASYKWEKLSGPAAGLMSNMDSPTLELAGLVDGVYSFMITVVSNKGCVASDEVKVKVFLPTGVDEINNSELKVFPNPSSDGKFIVQLPNGWVNKRILLRITDLTGRVVSEQWIDGTANGTIQTSKPLGSGSYIMNVHLDDQIETAKLIVE